MSKIYQHLYEVSIEGLELSDIAINALKRTGMTSVGDCIDFHIRGTDAMISVQASFFTVIYGEVKEKLIEHGYWSYVEDNLEE